MSTAAATRVSPDEARRLLAAGPVTILDVRTPQEFTRLGHLAGAQETIKFPLPKGLRIDGQTPH